MKKLIVLASLIISSVFSMSQAETQYTITDLGTLGGNKSAAYSINDSGQTAGYALTDTGAYRAFMHDGTKMHDLDTLGGTASKAWSINDDGQVAGESYTATGKTHAFLHDGTEMLDLDTLGGTSSIAYGINNSGHVVGISLTIGGAYHAFLHNGIEMIDLGVLGGTSSRAYAINDSGQVAGFSSIVGSGYHAFLHDGTKMHDLGTLGTSSYASGINNSGHVVGYSISLEGDYLAFLHDGTEMRDLGNIGGNRTYARAINDDGQVVGYGRTADNVYHAFLYDANNQMLDLNDLIDPNSGWVLEHAYDINNSDQIVGYGIINSQYHAYLLTPKTTATIPIADAGIDLKLSADGQCGAAVTLDGTASSDPDGRELAYFWYYNEELLSESAQFDIDLGLGVYTFTLIVNNGQKDSLPDEVVITVVDKTPPQVSVTMEPSILRPADKKMVEVTPIFTASDNCSEEFTVVLIEITCNQKSEGDIEITDEGIFLRAKRDSKGKAKDKGKGKGKDKDKDKDKGKVKDKDKEDRIYTITYKVTDQSGNETITSAEVKVPQKQKKTK